MGIHEDKPLGAKEIASIKEIGCVFSRGNHGGKSIFASKVGRERVETAKDLGVVPHDTKTMKPDQRKRIFDLVEVSRQYAAKELKVDFELLSLELIEVCPESFGSLKVKKVFLLCLSQEGGRILVEIEGGKPTKAEWLDTPDEAA